MEYNTPVSHDTLTKTQAALEANGFKSILASSKEDALKKIKSMIPAGISVMNGSSTTLIEIGFVEYLKDGEHGWNNVHEAIVAEADPQKKAELRKSAITSEYYLGSAHAITEDGKIIVASASGSQLPHLAFTSQNIVLVVGTQKIVADLAQAFDRMEKHIIPLEDERMKSTGAAGTMWAKTLILNKEPAFMGRSVTIIFVEEALGF